MNTHASSVPCFPLSVREVDLSLRNQSKDPQATVAKAAASLQPCTSSHQHPPPQRLQEADKACFLADDVL